MSSTVFQMRLSLNVLEHLGINLYSNVPSVLSEVVANAWDADAETVKVTFDKSADTIEIEDDGVGMTPEEVNARFLTVGYRRRNHQPPLTAKGRKPMGRKGIGKLSLFSIADKILIETAKDNTKSAFLLDLKKMRQAIDADEGRYVPDMVSTDRIDFEHGLKITLSGLKKKQTINTSEGLRKRLARRFSIIGPQNGFSIEVHGDEITPADRGYFPKLRYLWTYGDQSKIVDLSTNLEHLSDRTRSVSGNEISIEGWIGTVAESGQLQDDFGENLNRIAIFVRGKMAQEDILGEFTERGVYASYLIGEIHVDALDVDEGPGGKRDDDAATSSRQKLVEDDPRYVAVKAIIGQELKHIQTAWAKLRSDEGAKKALQIPAIASWIEGLPVGLRPKAKRWLGKINQISVDEPEERRQLWKHSVLAFEFYRWNDNLERLEDIDANNLDAAIALFSELDSLEANLYGQIVQQRVEVIRALQEKVDDNALEKVIQRYIFEHLWLLDPSWERVEASEVMEKRVDQLFAEIDAKLTPEQMAGRLDIQYRKTSGTHVIIELKRPEVSTSVYDLARQVGKYRSGLREILRSMGKGDEPIDVRIILGKDPTEWGEADGPKTVQNTLEVHSARIEKYNELLENAFDAYSDYAARKKSVDRLGEIIQAIDDYAE